MITRMRYLIAIVKLVLMVVDTGLPPVSLSGDMRDKLLRLSNQSVPPNTTGLNELAESFLVLIWLFCLVLGVAWPHRAQEPVCEQSEGPRITGETTSDRNVWTSVVKTFCCSQEPVAALLLLGSKDQ